MTVISFGSIDVVSAFLYSTLISCLHPAETLGLGDKPYTFVRAAARVTTQCYPQPGARGGAGRGAGSPGVPPLLYGILYGLGRAGPMVQGPKCVVRSVSDGSRTE